MSTTEPEPTPSQHFIDITIDPLLGNSIQWSVRCEAPEGAYCRMHCGVCEDYERPEHAAEHVLSDQGHCLLVEGWFDDSSLIVELYDGPKEPLRGGPIDLSWDGDSMTWKYAA